MPQQIFTEREHPGLSSPTGKPKAYTPLGTPMSQASTAPPSPMFSFSLDKMVRAISNSSECFLEESEDDNAQELLLDWQGATTSMSDEEDSIGFGIRPLKSELGRWALSQVERENAISFGLRPLQSELARWAQAQVNSEKWLKDTLSRRRRSVGPQLYLVDGAILEASCDGIAFRCSKDFDDVDCEAAGVEWGDTVSGVCHTDGWLEVIGGGFLPMFVDGVAVLKRVDPVYDGPALTADGRVLDLDGGFAVGFAHSREAAFGTEVARGLKVLHKLRASQRAQARFFWAACVVDSAGVVRSIVPTCEDLNPGAVRRAKLFHQKKQARGQGAKDFDDSILCTSPGGRVLLHLTCVDREERQERLRRRRALLLSQMRQPTSSGEETMVVDAFGVLQHDDV